MAETAPQSKPQAALASSLRTGRRTLSSNPFASTPLRPPIPPPTAYRLPATPPLRPTAAATLDSVVVLDQVRDDLLAPSASGSPFHHENESCSVTARRCWGGGGVLNRTRPFLYAVIPRAWREVQNSATSSTIGAAGFCATEEVDLSCILYRPPTDRCGPTFLSLSPRGG